MIRSRKRFDGRVTCNFPESCKLTEFYNDSAKVFQSFQTPPPSNFRSRAFFRSLPRRCPPARPASSTRASSLIQRGASMPCCRGAISPGKRAVGSKLLPDQVPPGSRCVGLVRRGPHPLRTAVLAAQRCMLLCLLRSAARSGAGSTRLTRAIGAHLR